jgi:hypothetical protein
VVRRGGALPRSQAERRRGQVGERVHGGVVAHADDGHLGTVFDQVRGDQLRDVGRCVVVGEHHRRRVPEDPEDHLAEPVRHLAGASARFELMNQRPRA